MNIVAALAAAALAAAPAMAQLADYQYQVSECVGIYSARDVAGARPGSIDVKFTPYAPQGQVALAFVNYLDTGLLARRTTGSFALCTAFDISAGLCEPSELGKVHVLRAANDSRVAPIVTERVLWAPPGTPALSALPEPERRRLERRQSQPASSLPASASSSAAASSAASVTSSAGAATSSAAAPTSSAQPAPTSSSLPSPSPSPSPSPAPIVYVQNSTMRFKYEIESSGLYCVIILTDLQSDYDYGLDITISNPYGLLPGLFYPALVFYGVISMAYLAVGVVWMVLSFRYWSDLLPIQHYVSGVIAFLILEMAFNFGLYENFNKTGVVSTFLMVLVVVFNAGRVSLSFFMLLIVSLGYGVVKPTLGDTMKRCVMLAALHFVFGVSYSAASLLAVEKNVALVVFLAIPLGLTMMGFYTWFFTGLMRTMQTLELRRQSVKLLMYKRLGYILTGSAIAIFVIAIANSINISHRNDPQWVASQWRWRWMLLDGSMNIVYFVVFVLIAVLWRPTENNQRYGLDQLAQDDPDEEMSHGIRLRDVTQPSDDFDEFDEDFGGLQADEFESADEVLKWVEQNVGGTTTHHAAAASGGAAAVASGSAASTGLGIGEVAARSRAHPPPPPPPPRARMDSEDLLLQTAQSNDKLI